MITRSRTKHLIKSSSFLQSKQPNKLTMGGNTRTKQPNKTHPLNGRTKQNTEQFKNSAEQNTKPKTRPERFETRTPERSEHRTAFANTRTLFCPSPVHIIILSYDHTTILSYHQLVISSYHHIIFMTKVSY